MRQGDSREPFVSFVKFNDFEKHKTLHSWMVKILFVRRVC